MANRQFYVIYIASFIFLSACTNQIQEVKKDSYREEIVKKLEEPKERVVTGPLVDKDGLSFVPNEDKPFTGSVVSYYKNGNKELEFSHKKGRTTSFARFYENGNKQSETTYDSDGNPETTTFWWKNGELWETFGYKNGKKHGFVVSYAPNGSKSSEVNYVNGLMDGVEKLYSQVDGKKLYEISYKDGKKNGPEILFYSNGRKLSEVNHVNDNRIGEELFWDSDGEEMICRRRKSGEIDVTGCKHKEKRVGGVTKCVSTSGIVRYLESYSSRQEIQSLISGDGYSCKEVIRGWTDKEIKESAKQERELAREAYNRRVRETAKFLDDVEAARKRR